jgi:hypothetical protein
MWRKIYLVAFTTSQCCTRQYSALYLDCQQSVGSSGQTSLPLGF